MADVRLIDANAPINVLCAKLRRIDNGRTMRQAAIPVADGMRIMELEYCIGLIQCADTIDAVPVVRCRECIHCLWDESHKEKKGRCMEHHLWCEADGFCHMGAKKDGGADDGCKDHRNGI